MNISLISSARGEAGFQSQAFSALAASAPDFDSIFASVAAGMGVPPSGDSVDLLSWLTSRANLRGLSPTGRNTALSDPESAYKMMSIINNKDVYFKAQFSELSQMQSAISQMQKVGEGLEDIPELSGNDSIKSRLQQFVDQYNDWVQRFSPDVQSGGLLADTQAAQVALHELDQSVEYTYNGAKDGLYGLRDIGITIDPVTSLATLDNVKLDAMLATNKQGVVDTVQEFSANFAKSASLLNSDGNFMPRQLDNLSRAIHYIADNAVSLRAEFGTGDTAKPTGKIAQALAAYNQTHAVI